MNSPILAAAKQERRHDRFAGIGIGDIAVLICLIIIGTRFEFQGNEQGPGLALVIRLMGGLLALGLLLVRSGGFPKRERAAIIGLICSYFLAINVIDLAYFTVMAVVSMAWGLSMSSAVISARTKSFDFALSGYLIFHVAGITFVSLWHVAFGQLVDLHKFLFPFSESRSGEIMNVTRLSGFHIEPGTYCNYMYLFVLLRALVNKRLLTWLNGLAIMSMIVATSAWSAIAIVFFLIGALFEFVFRKGTHSASTKLALMWTLGLLALVALSTKLNSFADTDYVRYMLERFIGEGADASRIDKTVAIEQWWNNIYSAIFIGHPMTQTFCPTCLSPQDIGIAPNLAFNFGLLPSVLLGLCIAIRLLRNWGLAFLVFFVPFLVNKAFFYDPLVWLVIGIILYSPAATWWTRRHPYPSHTQH